MPEYKSLTTDELHKELEEWRQAYDRWDEETDWVMRDEAVKQLTAISTELRKRGELWIKLTDDDLFYRYRAGRAMVESGIEEFAHDSAPTTDEWRIEIIRRGHALPTEPMPLDEAEAYFFDNAHRLDEDRPASDWNWDDGPTDLDERNRAQEQG